MSKIRARRDAVLQHESFVRVRQAWADLITRRPFSSAAVVYVLVLGLYVAGEYLTGTAAAFRYLAMRGGTSPARPDVPATHFQEVFWDSLSGIAVAVVVLVLVLKLLGVRARAVLAPGSPSSTGFNTLIYIALMLLAAAVMAGLSGVFGFESSYPMPEANGPWTLPGSLLDTLRAGFGEEILLVIVPVLLLRSVRQPWWAILTVLTVLRVSFHAYYGWPALGLILWAFLAVVFFYFTRCGVALIAGHAIRNAMGVLVFFGGEVGANLLGVLVLVMLIAVVVFAFRVDRRKGATTPA